MTEQEKSKIETPEENKLLAGNVEKAKKAERKSKLKKQKQVKKKETKERKRKVNRDDVKKDLKKMSISAVAKKYHISSTYAWRIKHNRFHDKPKKK